MAERHVVHRFDCSAETYWRAIFLADEFNRTLFLERLGFQRWEVVQLVEAGQQLTRELEAEPPVGKVPGPLKRVLASGTGYREKGTLDFAASRYSFSAVTHSLADRLSIDGSIQVTDVDGGCERSCSFTAKARLFGVGGLLEQSVLDGMAKSYDKSAEFTKDWLARKI